MNSMHIYWSASRRSIIEIWATVLLLQLTDYINNSATAEF